MNTYHFLDCTHYIPRFKGVCLCTMVHFLFDTQVQNAAYNIHQAHHRGKAHVSCIERDMGKVSIATARGAVIP